MTDVGLQYLPPELLLYIQLYALSEHFPATSRYIHSAFSSPGVSFCYQYLTRRALSQGARDMAKFLTKALRHPMCTEEVVKFILNHPPDGILHANASKNVSKFELPRRLFRWMNPDAGLFNWEEDPRFKFLRYLFKSPGLIKPNPNAFDGYALTRAVHARCIPLVRFLLEHGADPQCKNCLAIFVAIRKQDLALVKMLIERDDSPYDEVPGIAKRKRRKLEDRVVVNQAMIKAAVKCDARNIVLYFREEKGLVPDRDTLRMI